MGQHEALKRTIRAARSNANIKSDQELALRSGVHLQTIQNWMYGKTTPRPSELAKVAQALDMSMADLMAVYEGRDPQPQPLQDAVRELTDAVRELVDEMREERERGEDAASAMLRAAKVALGAPPKPGAAPASNGRRARRETTGSGA